jgi:hypothetical protein
MSATHPATHQDSHHTPNFRHRPGCSTPVAKLICGAVILSRRCERRRGSFCRLVEDSNLQLVFNQ